MKRELRIFLTTLMFYTRIPCPSWVGHEPEYIDAATRYFPLVGWLSGLLGWGVYVVAAMWWSPSLSILLAMAAGIALTGAFHEDGFADVCDGFGGGWTREKILTIMKDSRVGTYGVVGLVLLLGIRFYTWEGLANLSPVIFLLMLVAAHTLSRWSAIVLIYTSTYARDTADSKVKPVAESRAPINFWLATVFTAVPLVALCVYMPMAILCMVPVLISTLYLRRYYIKWIGGYTGDCLGAAQQVNEALFLLTLCALAKYI